MEDKKNKRCQKLRKIGEKHFRGGEGHGQKGRLIGIADERQETCVLLSSARCRWAVLSWQHCRTLS